MANDHDTSTEHRREHDMTATPTFSTPVIGQTEKALNAILARELAGTGVTEPQWVTLTLTLMSGGTVDQNELVGRVAGALKVSDADAQAQIAELAAAKLLRVPEGERSTVSVTDAGRDLHGQIRTTVTEITQRLWGDLPAEDLATAGRVLSTVLARANAELADARYRRRSRGSQEGAPDADHP
jgi:DNA-binding MarR family transcriptional regulator